jgi:hypothetical protein
MPFQRSRTFKQDRTTFTTVLFGYFNLIRGNLTGEPLPCWRVRCAKDYNGNFRSSARTITDVLLQMTGVRMRTHPQIVILAYTAGVIAFSA